MYEIGVILGILISILYPLSIAIVFKKFKFNDELWKYLFIAFILGAIFFFIGLIRSNINWSRIQSRKSKI